MTDRQENFGDMNRRSFLKVTALASGALLVGVGAYGAALAGADTDETWVPNLYVRIDADGKVTIISKNPEGGQGVKTAFPMVVAECLEVDWHDVQVETADIAVDNRYGRQALGGSRGTPDGWDDLRVAGTAAKVLLVAAAAQEWGVPAADCYAEKGMVILKSSGESKPYASLLNAAATLPVPDVSTLKLKSRPEEFKLLGTFVPGVDNPQILTGQPLFGCDVRKEGMLYAQYVKCPTFGGKVRRANVESVAGLPGITHAFVVEGTDNLSGPMPGGGDTSSCRASQPGSGSRARCAISGGTSWSWRSPTPARPSRCPSATSASAASSTCWASPWTARATCPSPTRPRRSTPVPRS